MNNEKEPLPVARESVDDDRLLPGEDSASADPEDIQPLVAVYEELLSGNRSIIGTLRDSFGHPSPGASRELEQPDLALLEAQLQRFERRLSFWREKLQSAG